MNGRSKSASEELNEIIESAKSMRRSAKSSVKNQLVWDTTGAGGTYHPTIETDLFRIRVWEDRRGSNVSGSKWAYDIETPNGGVIKKREMIASEQEAMTESVEYMKAMLSGILNQLSGKILRRGAHTDTGRLADAYVDDR